MTRAQHRRRCAQKIAFERESDAAAKRDAEVERGGDRLSIYRCKCCGAYHLGHERRSTGRLRRATARFVLAERQLLQPARALRTVERAPFNSIRKGV